MWPSAQISLKQMHLGYNLGPTDFAGKSKLFLLRDPRWGMETDFCKRWLLVLHSGSFAIFLWVSP